MRALFCGGGTAGHVNPALAIAQTILKNSPSSEIAYVTTKGGIENKLVPFKKYEIEMSGLKRSFSLSNIKMFFVTVSAIGKCKKIIREFKPDVIIGTGGYACFPVIYAGSRMGIKCVIHESNAIPGMALKMLEKRVDKIFLNFKDAGAHFSCKNKLVYAGNPLREGFGMLTKEEARKKLGIRERFVILCYGGSLGAKVINDGALQIVENLIKDDKNIRLIWASGKREYKNMYYEVKDRGFDNLENLDFSEYIYDMEDKIASADIVISRAGAMSISEMAYCKKCSIFIPSPNVVDNHQHKNASVLSNASAAILLPESKIFDLIDVLKDLLENDKKREEYSKKISAFSIGNSNKIIYREIKDLLKKRK